MNLGNRRLKRNCVFKNKDNNWIPKKKSSPKKISLNNFRFLKRKTNYIRELNGENSTLNNVFSMKTPFSAEIYKSREALFLNNKWKPFSIIHGHQISHKIHGEILQEDFPETLQLFESSTEIFFPEDTDSQCLELIVKYFYFKEIAPITLSKLFPLLDLAIFFKVIPIIHNLKDFLLNEVEISKNAKEMFKCALNLYVSKILEEYDSFMEEVIKKSLGFLIKARNPEEILANFDPIFFQNLKDEKVFSSFELLICVFKEKNANNEIFLDFLVLYQGKLASSFTLQDKKFEMQKFFTNFIKKYLDLTKLTPNTLNEYMQKLGLNELEGNLEMKDLVMRAMGENITKNTVKIKELENQVLTLQTELENLKQLVEKSPPSNENQNFETIRKILNQVLKEKVGKKTPCKTIKNTSPLDYIFWKDEMNREHFSFRNQNKTVQKISRNFRWDGVCCREKSLGKSKEKSFFSIRIDKITEGFMMIGFCIRKKINSNPRKFYHQIYKLFH